MNSTNRMSAVAAVAVLTLAWITSGIGQTDTASMESGDPVESFLGYELVHYGYDEHFCWPLADTPHAETEKLAAAMGGMDTPVYTFELNTGQSWDMCLWPAAENWEEEWNYSNCDFNRNYHGSSWSTLIHADEGAEYIHSEFSTGPQDEMIVYTGSIADKMICVDSSSYRDLAHAEVLLFEGDTRAQEKGTGPEDCIDGRAGDFPCSGISLAARVTLRTMGGAGAAGSDLWGWTDPETAREYALMGLSNGTGFVDVTEPQSPVFLGRLPTHTTGSFWRDIKVYRDHAYIVADGAGEHGMQVFDLTRLRGVSGPRTWAADAHYGEFGHSHNLAIDERSGFAYAVSTDTCAGGLHIVNLATPNDPLFAGCHNVTKTHDTQCVVYEGPDTRHRGRQICVSSNEYRVEVVDVTEKAAPLSLSSITYPQMRYAHQGWLTEDHRYFLLGDELDEIDLNLSTRTHVFDVSDLDAPRYLYAHDLGTSATDHNLYVLGERVYEANYTSGLRVLRFGDLASRDMAEIAFFDTYPDNDGPGFEGAWSVYPYLPSGTVLVSDFTNGLFVLSMP